MRDYQKKQAGKLLAPGTGQYVLGRWFPYKDQSLGKANRKWKMEHPDETKERQRIRYRIRQEKYYGVEYPKLTTCGICGKEISGRQIVLDHNHDTGVFRGWLCIACNVRLDWTIHLQTNIEKYLKNAKIRVLTQ